MHHRFTVLESIVEMSSGVNRAKAEPRFTADRMLGRLARYLRLLGYDVIYPSPCPDSRLVSISRAQNRILLTRDLGIPGHESALTAAPKVVWISSTNVLGQLSQLAREGWIESILDPRCSACNTLLEEMSYHEARHILHPYTLATQLLVLYCPSCNIALWEGSHWALFRARIARIVALD